jgi:uncharacterized protein YndB with AHSA1/START domain
MAEETRQVVTGTVDAAPDKVFAVLCDPARHPEFDGSSMCAASADGPVTAVGQTFVVDMYREGLGNYQIRNKVVAFEPGRRFVFEPFLETSNETVDGLLNGIKPGGHTWGFDLEPTGDGRTRVTHIYDWTNIYDERYGAFFPFITVEEMSSTIARLGEVAAKA